MTVECRDCGAEFSLEDVWYYDNLCPACMAGEEPERTWPGCAVCGERIPPGERAAKRILNRTLGTFEHVPVHRRCKT